MRVYLKNSSILESITIEDTEVPGNSPSNPSGNIIVESGQYQVNSTLEMLPNAIIRVKPGAALKVQATITGACDQLWHGVIVEGDAFDDSQSPALQGQVIVSSTGKIEHALVAIDVQDPDNLSGSGGGLVKVINGHLQNNIISIRFGQYTYPNKSVLYIPRFSTTDDYRGGTIRPVHLDINAIKGLSIKYGFFQDFRTQCTDPSLRAIGIDSKNAGLRVLNNTKFENLYTGIKADKLTETNGSLTLSGCNFIRCYKGVELIKSSSFFIAGNSFSVKKPEDCPSLAIEVKGVEIRGKTTGFTFSDNDFAGEQGPFETLIGTDCISLDEGMANTIFKNNYSDLTIGNRASGSNGYDNDGLLYLCNTNENFDTDFLITDGSIRKTQGEITDLGPILPTGNTFSADPTFLCTIVNQGLEIDYYFYDGDPEQDPGTPGASINECDIIGFQREPVSQSNGNCDNPEPPCSPCPEIALNAWKTNFHQNRQQWLAKTAAFSSITSQAQREAEAEAIHRLRIAMNRDGSRVLMQYNLDTLDIEVDSIIHWLALVETYPADLRLAHHHFFTGDYTAFYSLWGQIPAKYELSEDAEDEFERLGEVYDTLRVHLSVGTPLEKLPQPTIETLKTWASNCDEPGFLSEVVLWRNGIEYRPDCSGEESKPVVTISDSPNNEKQQPLKIYPNPTNNSLNVEYPILAKQGRLRLFNLQGQTVSDIPLFEKSSLISVQVSHFTPGVYLVELHCGQGLPIRKKVVISQ